VVESDIWREYRALHDAVGFRVDPRPRPPPPYPIRPADQQAARSLAFIIQGAAETYPIPCPPKDYTFLYLFQQLIRCSYPLSPHRLLDGWHGLRWLPLSALLGKEPDAGTRFWANWYRNTYAKPIPRPTPHDLLTWYPRGRAKSQSEYLDSSLAQLHRLCTQHRALPIVILENLDALGHDRQSTPVPIEWHPLLLLAISESYSPDRNGTSLIRQRWHVVGKALRELARSPQRFRQFRELVAHLQRRYPQPEAWEIFQDGIDDLFCRGLLDDKDHRRLITHCERMAQ
jgi:hypothetical protein